jgi:hypothetical protein
MGITAAAPSMSQPSAARLKASKCPIGVSSLKMVHPLLDIARHLPRIASRGQTQFVSPMRGITTACG